MSPSHDSGTPPASTTIHALLAREPDARAVLHSFGIDTCCGGELSLAQAVEVRGVSLPELLGALGHPHTAEKFAVRVSGRESVRALIAREPRLASVFERHGLMGCGGTAGPDEPIDLFARLHHVPLEALLAELEQEIARPAAAPALAVERSPVRENEAGSATLYRRFVIAALACTTTLGATFGAYNLFAFHTGIGPATPAHNWTHAGFQVMGFVLLFTMGVSYHAVPRFLGGALARPGLARASFWLALSGLLVRTYGHLAGLVPGPLVGILLGSLLQAAAVLCWAVVLFTTRRRSAAVRERFHDFLVAGTLLWILAAAIQVAGAIHAVAGQDPNYASRWNEPHYAAALFGGTLLWIQGMFLRTGPSFLGLRATREGPVEIAFALGAVGALAVVAGGLVGFTPLGCTLVDGGLLGVAGSLAVFTFAVRIFERREEAGDRAFARTMRASFGGGLLFVVLASTFAVADLVGSRLPSLVFDGARHAFGLGFVALALFGMAGRIVPVFAGTRLRWPAAHSTGVVLVVVGILLRESEVVLSLGGPNWLLWVSGTSGFVAASGVLLLSASIFGTLRAGAAEPLPRTPVWIGPDANVAALVSTHPESLPILIAAGFTPLANPILRNTFARAVTLGQACRMHRIELAPLLESLRRACPHGSRGRPLQLVGKGSA